MSNPTAETEVCTHCGGTGVEPARAAEFFPVGSKVVWVTGSWWGKVPAEVIGHSRSGERVRIKYRGPRMQFDTYSYVKPKSLEISA